MMAQLGLAYQAQTCDRGRVNTTGDKIALITGAARGLGRCIAVQLAARGYRIAGLDTRAQELGQTMEDIREAQGVETLALVCDVSREAQVRDAVGRALAHFGHVDLLVSNAGYREVGKVWTLSTENWERTLGTNLKGAFLLTRELLAGGMLERDAGKLIYISSDAGVHGSEDSSIYCASKWGLRGFAASVAKDLRRTQIRVTTILPGMIETPMARESEVWDQGLVWLDPDHVARAVVQCAELDPTVHVGEMLIHDKAYI